MNARLREFGSANKAIFLKMIIEHNPNRPIHTGVVTRVEINGKADNSQIGLASIKQMTRPTQNCFEPRTNWIARTELSKEVLWLSAGMEAVVLSAWSQSFLT